MYQYSYLLGDIILLVIWLVFWFWRKDIRKEMLIISVIFGIAGLAVEWIYIIDYWTPLTVTNTPVGIEDFLFGFTVGGIAAVIYEIFFKKKVKIKKAKKNKKMKRDRTLSFMLFLVAILFFGSFFFLRMNSFWASVIAFMIPLIIIYVKRVDLIKSSIISGILSVLVAFIVFWAVDLITPGWIESAWHFVNIPKTIILRAPLEDLIWALFAGAFIGPLYEYWQEGRLVKK